MLREKRNKIIGVGKADRRGYILNSHFCIDEKGFRLFHSQCFQVFGNTHTAFILEISADKCRAVMTFGRYVFYCYLVRVGGMQNGKNFSVQIFCN